MTWWRFRRAGQDAAEAATTPLERLQERASAYLDDELTPADRAAFEAELATSEAAREQLDDLRLVRSVLGGVGLVRAPRSFALVAPPAPVRAGPRRLEWATRAGTGIAALLFVAALTNGPSSGDTPITTGSALRESAPQAAPKRAETAADSGAGAAAFSTPATPTATPEALAPVTAAAASVTPPATPASAPAAAPVPSGRAALPPAGGAGGGTGGGLQAAPPNSEATRTPAAADAPPAIARA
ncbi:MAG: anti-sigma factor, partial [Dehalococcoidia bacterium]